MNKLIVSVVVVMAACSAPPQQPMPTVVDPACKGDALEPDAMPSPWFGAGVVDGGVPAGTQYVISTTYLRLKPDEDTKKLFNDSNGPIVQALPTQDGLIAYRFISSEHCFTARTLTVWRDVMAMQRFSAGDAHRNAMVMVTDLSRGGSAVQHWTGTAEDATWERARTELGKDTGPQY
jgi:hypothetical protein